MSESEKKIEDFVTQFMAEEGIKGKARRIKITRIVEQVGFDKVKVRVALLRSTITERINHD
ncbi:MAG: hypothetical protein ACFFKA_09005 [Candidatus Thorarchaeota archaeon]